MSGFILRVGGGAHTTISEYGATVMELHVPDRSGESGPVALGFPTLAGYLAEHPHFGCVVGRYANRIANARFSIGGITFELDANEGPHHLHGGERGFHRRVWRGEMVEDATANGQAPAVRLRTLSPAGDQGYPGALSASVLYRLVHDGSATRLEITFEAETDAPTVVSLTHHGYFNLGDGGASDILDHDLTVHAQQYLPLGTDGIPTGEPLPVANTRLDLRTPRLLSSAIGGEGSARQELDDCFLLDVDTEGALPTVATLRHPASGRVLHVLTDQPSLQVYSAGGLDGSLTGHAGVQYRRNAGLCLETQHPPDAPNRATLPSPRLDPGERYRARVCYLFDAQ